MAAKLTTILILAIALLPRAPGQIRLGAPAAQPAPDAAAIPAAAEPIDSLLGRATPYGTVVGFMEAAATGDYLRASQYLQSDLSETEKIKLARQLHVVLNRGYSGDPHELSRSAGGDLDDDGRSRRRLLIGTAHAGDASLDLYLQRMPRGDRPPIWLFADVTLRLVPNFASRFDPTWLELYIHPLLPQWASTTAVLYVPVSQWLLSLFAFIATLALSYLAAEAANWLVVRSIGILAQRTGWAPVLRLKWPFRLLSFLFLISALSSVASTLVGRRILAHLRFTLITVGVAWVIAHVNDAICNFVSRRAERDSDTGTLVVAQLARGVAKVVVIVAALLVALAHAGVNLSTVLAGLGIGGVAVAFAAQKTLENLFGTVTIVMDQPARVGDLCRIGGFTGVIEKIGLRSTRFRTLENTILTMPNGQVSSLPLDNISARGKILFQHAVGLSYSTTANQLSAVLKGVEDMLRFHEKVESESVRVRLTRFGSSSLDVEVFAYVLEADLPRYLAIQQELLMNILRIVEASGTSIAFPSQTLYLEGKAEAQ
jgi:MscS family membrane protein